jgi:hypothetical protein
MALDLETRLFQPDEVKVTFIHKDDDSNYRSTRKWLDEMFTKGEGSKVSPIVVVADPEMSALYVYDGNKRTRRAKECQYPVQGLLIKDKADFDKFLEGGSGCWFGIKDFGELLNLMRMYAKNPNEGDMPPEMAAIVRPLMQARAEASYRELFPYDDDD